jgi:hypothetical protein
MMPNAKKSKVTVTRMKMNVACDAAFGAPSRSGLLVVSSGKERSVNQHRFYRGKLGVAPPGFMQVCYAAALSLLLVVLGTLRLVIRWDLDL